jgi:hypothetical protein
LCCVSSQKWIGVLFFDACLFCMFTFPGPFSFSWSHEHLVIFPFLSLFWGFPTIMGLASFMSFSFLSHRWIADLRFFVAVTSCLFFSLFTKHHVNMSIGNQTYHLYNHSIAPPLYQLPFTP